MTAGKTAVFDEVGNHRAEPFVHAAIRTLTIEMDQHLSLVAPAPVQVALSPSSVHAERFPPAALPVLDLLDHRTRDELERGRDAEAQARAMHPDSYYGFAIAAMATTELRPPHGMLSDRPAVFIDIPTAERIADDLDVDLEALLLATLAHELSHVWREHAEHRLTSHRALWLSEGDAQRDSWEILLRLLESEPWSVCATRACAAQVRLAGKQPPAYRAFRPEKTVSTSLLHGPLEQRTIELPTYHVPGALVDEHVSVTVKSEESPSFGDWVRLRDYSHTSGTWVVVDVTPVTHSTPRRKPAFGETAPGNENRLTLRPLGVLGAVPADERRSIRRLLHDVDPSDLRTPEAIALAEDLAMKERGDRTLSLKERLRRLRAEEDDR